MPLAVTTRRHRVAAVAGALAVLGAAAACSNDRTNATGPQVAAAAPRQAVTQTTIIVPALTRDVPLAQDITVSAPINKQGGTLTIPEAGLKVVVPAGAVKRRTIFTATAKAGWLVAYDFGPSGSRFDVPIRVSQDLKGTNWWRVALDPSSVQGAYYASDAQLYDNWGAAAVNEFVPTTVDLNAAKVTLNVSHFSGYIIATGTGR